MNPQLKTILLTVLSISSFVIALVELSGVSQTALINKYKFGTTAAITPEQAKVRDETVVTMPKTTMEFYEKKYNFGKVKEGEIVRHDFKFKNTGVNPLFISKTDVSCGCTVPSFSKEPIAPGQDGVITVEYNSRNHPGHQQKNVMVHSNAVPDAVSIGFEADVRGKDQKDK